MKIITIRIDEETDKILKAKAKEECLSVACVIRRILKKELKK